MPLGGNVVIKASLDASQAKQGLQSLKGSLSSTSDGFRELSQSISLGNIAADLFSKAMGAIGSSLGAAVKRVDTIGNFPLIMESLGYSSEDAAKSIDKMSSKLDGLPTSLDAMVSATQKIAPLTGTLDEATDIALAFNNALLAGGKSTTQQANALEQYSQMLAVGKVDMRAWRSMVDAMPGQMDQLAKSILGANAGQAQLYEAMKEGTVTFDDFNNAVLKLNEKGYNGLANFEQQARAATGGIGTAVENLKNRLARSIAILLDEIGRENIADYINDFSSSFAGMAKGIGRYIPQIMSAVKPLLEFIKDNFASIAKVIAGITAGKAALSFVKRLVGTFASGANAFLKFGDGITSVSSSLFELASKTGLAETKVGGLIARTALAGPGVAALAATLGIATAAMIAFAAVDVIKHFNQVERSTNEMNEAIFGTSEAAGDAKGALEMLSKASDDTHRTADEFYDSMRKTWKSIKERDEAVKDSNAVLDTYGSKIEELAGRSDLSAGQVAQLELAVDELNSSLGTNYEVVQQEDGTYQIIADGATVAKDAIYDLIEAQKAQAMAEAYADDYAEAVKAQADAEEFAAQKEQDYYNGKLELFKLFESGKIGVKEYKDGVEELKKQWDDAVASAETAAGGVDFLAEKEALAKKAAEEGASSLTRFFNSNDQMKKGVSESGKTLEEFRVALEQSGVSVEQLGNMSSAQAEYIGASFNGSAQSITDATGRMSKISAEDFGLLWAKCNGNVSLVNQKLSEMEKHADSTGDAIDDIPTSHNTKVSESGTRTTEEKMKLLDKSISKVPATKSIKVKADTISAITALTSLRNKAAKDIVQNLIVKQKKQGEQAAGGVFTGSPNILGRIPRHADGGILAHPTLTPVGWVGEAGAEAIIPLDNRRYVGKFAAVVADSVMDAFVRTANLNWKTSPVFSSALLGFASNGNTVSPSIAPSQQQNKSITFNAYINTGSDDAGSIVDGIKREFQLAAARGDFNG